TTAVYGSRILSKQVWLVFDFANEARLRIDCGAPGVPGGVGAGGIAPATAGRGAGAALWFALLWFVPPVFVLPLQAPKASTRAPTVTASSRVLMSSLRTGAFSLRAMRFRRT